jgi:serine protease Do
MATHKRMRRWLFSVCVSGLMLATVLPAAAQEAEPDRDAEPAPVERSEAADDSGAESVEGAAANRFERAVQLIEPSVVYIDVTVVAWVNDGEDWLNDGAPYEVSSHCSGTIINSTGYILTAGHCVDPDQFRGVFIDAGVEEWIENGWNLNDDGSEWLSPNELSAMGYDNWKVEGESPGSAADVELSVQLATSVSGLSGGRVMGARLVDFTSLKDGDVALIKVEQTDLPVTPVATTDPSVGADIVAVGFPASVDLVTDPDLNAAYKDGRISQHRTRDGGTLPVWEISAAMSGGMSGGPTSNMEGEIVGVNSYGIEGEDQQFNFVSPAQLVREIASRNGVSLELDETSEAYRDGVIALNVGDHQEAIDSFDQVLATSPSHSKAAELKRIAEGQLAEAPPEDPTPVTDDSGARSEGAGFETGAAGQGLSAWAWATIAALAILILMVGGLSVVLVRTRKSNPGPGLVPHKDGQVTVDLEQEREAEPKP